MPACHYCGATPNVPNRCNHCGEPVCEDHALPENHDCVGLKVTDKTVLGTDDDAILGAGEDDSSQQPLESDAENPESDDTAEASRDSASDKTEAGDAGDDDEDLSPREKQLKAQREREAAQDGTTSGCLVCGDSEYLLRRCNECGQTVCTAHRLPEEHDCASQQATHRTRTASANGETHAWTYVLGLPVLVGWGLYKVAPYALAGVVLVVAAINVGLVAPGSVPGGDAVKVDMPQVSSSNTNTGGPAGPRNESAVERHFLEMLNEERKSRGLQTVTQRDVLTKMGRSHSQDMAAKGYFSHTEPDGDTIKDRYEARGLLPECELSTESGGYYPGTENIWQGAVYANLQTEAGIIETNTAEAVARAMFVSWMNSEGHREAMLVPSADEAGLGLAITDDGTVYASLELC